MQDGMQCKYSNADAKCEDGHHHIFARGMSPEFAVFMDTIIKETADRSSVDQRMQWKGGCFRINFNHQSGMIRIGLGNNL